MGLRRFLLLVAVMIGMLSSAAYAGVVVSYQDGSVAMAEKGRIKQSGGSEGGGAIIDLNRDELILMNDDNRTYIQTTLKEYCDTIKSAMEKMLQDLPPEQRRMMEQMGGGNRMGRSVKIRVEKAGSGGKVAGYSTVKYKVYENGRLYEEIWMAKGTPIEKEMKSMKRIERFSQKMKNCAATPGMPEEVSPYEASKEYQAIFDRGWVMRRITHMAPMMPGDRSTEKEEVTRIEVRRIPASEFQPPRGYRRIPVSQMYMMQ